MHKFFSLLAVLALAGCNGSLPPVNQPPIPCKITPPTRPALVTDDQLRALGDYALPLALYLDRRDREGYEAQLEAAVKSCQ